MPKINVEKKQLNKDRILESASKIFYEKGYNKTSVNDIVKNANISKGQFYTYFDSKEELFFDIIHNADAEIRDTEIEFDVLEKYIEYRLKRFFDNDNRMRSKYTFEFWSSASLTEKQKTLFDERYNEFQNDIITIIRKGQECGIYSKDIHVKTFVHVLMASLDGIIMMDSVLNQPITEDIIETTIKVFTCYIKEEKC